MIEQSDGCFCNVCSHHWTVRPATPRRFASIEDLVRRVPLRRDEISMLAEIGALNAFGMDRRSALWQVERVVRPPGELFEGDEEPDRVASGFSRKTGVGLPLPPDQPPLTLWRSAEASAEAEGGSHERRLSREQSAERHELSEQNANASPLDPMTPSERLIADYAGTSLTIGPHPMTYRRHELAMRGILRASDLPQVRTGRRVRTAGMVITRQRPGTAKGFVFLTLEDETGVANIIVRPDFYDKERATIITASFLIIEGIVQTVDGVTAVRAERAYPLEGLSADSAFDSHDFH
jgi:DNA polymerase III alpha subunit